MPELHLYDFDGTLFRSPYEPVAWDGDWWNDTSSLNPPCVPETPDSSWWNSQVVSQARSSIADPDVWAVLLTGRQDRSGFRFRIPELLRQAGLNFDQVGLAPPSGTIAWKKQTLAKLIATHPQVDRVQIWDDRPSHLREFEMVAQRMGVEIETHLVRTKSREPECSEGELRLKDQSKPPVYLAVFLDSKSRAALAHEYGYAHHKALSDHMTITTEVEPDDLQLIGTSVSMRVTGYYEDDKVQVVRVVPSLDVVRGRTPHVTMSVAEGTPPAQAAILVDKATPVRGPLLSGVIDTFPRSLRQANASAARVASLHLQVDNKR